MLYPARTLCDAKENHQPWFFGMTAASSKI
jgi:hypothetical protein